MRWTSLLIPILASCGGSDQNFSNLSPEIAVNPELVDFGEVVAPGSEGRQVFISNAGRATLEATLTLSGDEVFSMETTDIEVQPEESFELLVLFEPETFLPHDAVLSIASNDDEQPLIEVPLTGEGVDAPRPEIDVTPLTLDFGAVSPGSSLTEIVTVANTGLADLDVDDITQTGSGAFVLVSDPSHTTISAGDDFPLVVTYTPTGEDGDEGSIFIANNDGDESVVEVIFLGNGGGGFPYPEAIIDCPEEGAAPPEWITLDGSQSFDPDGGPLTYEWTLLSAPEGSQAALTSRVSETTDFFADLGGPYEVQLVVTNNQQTVSAPDRCLIEAVPNDDLHIELTWDMAGTDMDLHLLDNGATLFDKPGDCNYCNKNPKWGASGSGDDPRLDLDDRSDGPENINVFAPADGYYPVRVHFFEGAGAVTATVTVYTYGLEVWSGSKVMRRNDVWDVGQVNWPEGTFGTHSTDLYKADDRSCQ